MRLAAARAVPGAARSSVMLNVRHGRLAVVTSLCGTAEIGWGWSGRR